MRDEIFDREFQSAREPLNKAVDGLIERVQRLARRGGKVFRPVERSVPRRRAAEDDCPGIA